MKKFILTILGQDRPGIIAALTKILYQQDCNIEDVSQTILQSEFTGIFIVSIPEHLSPDDLNDHLQEEMAALDLHVHLKPLDSVGKDAITDESEPFIITTMGPDRKGLVAGITKIIAGFGVNITNLKAVFKGGDDPNNNIMIYEVDVPTVINQQALYEDLRKGATELGLEISIQHRNIFEAINRL